MDLTLAEVVRDQKHISRTGYFISAEHFSGILLPSGQETLFILLRHADSHHYIHLWYTEINGEFPTGRYSTLETMQIWLLISVFLLPGPAEPAVLVLRHSASQSFKRG